MDKFKRNYKTISFSRFYYCLFIFDACPIFIFYRFIPITFSKFNLYQHCCCCRTKYSKRILWTGYCWACWDICCWFIYCWLYVFILGSGLWITLPAAIVIAGLFGVAFAIPSFRLEGPYLALATLGGGEAIRLFIENGDFFMSTYGISNISQPIIFGVPFDTPDKYYYIAMPVMLIAVYFFF